MGDIPEILKEKSASTSEPMVFTISATPPCTHHTGWFGRVYFRLFWGLIVLSKKVYACSLCGEILQDKKLKEFEANHEQD